MDHIIEVWWAIYAMIHYLSIDRINCILSIGFDNNDIFNIGFCKLLLSWTSDFVVLFCFWAPSIITCWINIKCIFLRAKIVEIRVARVKNARTEVLGVGNVGVRIAGLEVVEARNIRVRIVWVGNIVVKVTEIRVIEAKNIGIRVIRVRVIGARVAKVRQEILAARRYKTGYCKWFFVPGI